MNCEGENTDPLERPVATQKFNAPQEALETTQIYRLTEINDITSDRPPGKFFHSSSDFGEC